MGRDTPDWGGSYNTARTYPLFDLSELAVRLASPIIYDRRGSLLWWCDFRNDLIAVLNDSYGGSSSVAITTARSDFGPKACRLTCGTGIGHYAAVKHFLPRIQDPALSGLAMVYGPGDHGLLTTRLNYTVGDDEYDAKVRYDNASQVIEIFNSSGAWETIVTGVDPLLYYASFVHHKLVVDSENHRYKRYLVNDVEYDLSDYDIEKSDAGTHRWAKFEIILQHDSAPAAFVADVDLMAVSIGE